jgi:hypothetical protein
MHSPSRLTQRRPPDEKATFEATRKLYLDFRQRDVNQPDLEDLFSADLKCKIRSRCFASFAARFIGWLRLAAVATNGKVI